MEPDDAEDTAVLIGAPGAYPHPEGLDDQRDLTLLRADLRDTWRGYGTSRFMSQSDLPKVV